MGYYKSQVRTTRYRVTVEELVEWTETPDRDELEKPVPEGHKKVVSAEDKQDWQQTDQLTTTSKAALAGLLRSKADELDPVDKTTYRGN